MRARINLEHILHGRDKRRIGGGWDHPIFLQMRLDIVFFKARPTVLKCAAATISRSTTVSASRTERPTSVARRRFRTGKRDQFGLALAIEDRLDRWCRALLASEHRVESVGDQPPKHTGYHRQFCM